MKRTADAATKEAALVASSLVGRETRRVLLEEKLVEVGYGGADLRKIDGGGELTENCVEDNGGTAKMESLEI